jgi:glycosyltransferase involved in cell wall biosynthesis
VFAGPPFPAAVDLTGPRDRAATGPDSIAVVIPTRDRPERLERCLAALAAARARCEFAVYVCDSSGHETFPQVAAVCEPHSFVRLVRHDRPGAAAARNVGTAHCTEELIVVLDDDVYVEPQAIAALAEAYLAGAGTRVIAGSVEWSHWRSRPLVSRAIGFSREASPGEEPELVVSALVMYPRALGAACPWNERLWPHDDLFASRLWRLAGARLDVAPAAVATHDEKQSQYPVAHAADLIYTNLFDAVFVRRSPLRLLGIELLGFAAACKHWVRGPASFLGLVGAWARGHAAFVRDLGHLRGAVARARRFRTAARDH